MMDKHIKSTLIALTTLSAFACDGSGNNSAQPVNHSTTSHSDTIAQSSSATANNNSKEMSSASSLMSLSSTPVSTSQSSAQGTTMDPDLRRFFAAIRSVDISQKTFEIFSRENESFNYAPSGFDEMLAAGDVIDILSEAESLEPLKVQELKVANEQTVTYAEQGRLSVNAISSDDIDIFLDFSDVIFTLAPDAEYGDTTFDELNQSLRDNTQAGDTTNLSIQSARVTYSQAEGFKLRRLIVDSHSSNGTIEGVLVNNNPGDAFNAQRATVTINGENYIIDNTTGFSEGLVFAQHRKSFTLDTLASGQFVQLGYWLRDNTERVVSYMSDACEFGINLSVNPVRCKTSSE